MGEDYPVDRLTFLSERGVDLSGVETAPGESFFWAGEYSFDLNSRETLETKLGVFADFKPPGSPPPSGTPASSSWGTSTRCCRWRFLDQVAAPSLVACDTMNYWISGSRENLLKLLARVDVLMVNDSEVRELAGEPNLMKAARWGAGAGPGHRGGEEGGAWSHPLRAHRGVLHPRLPPGRGISTPPGAGDAFAGGFLGYLAHTGLHGPR